MALIGLIVTAPVGECGIEDDKKIPEKTAETKEKKKKRPAPPGSSEYEDERKKMVKTQISHPRDGRKAVKSAAVLEAMRLAPRHLFVPKRWRNRAHVDSPLPIGHGQTISQPYMVAFMTELLNLKSNSRVLEIGTGSGYQAAILAHITPHVFSIEIVEALAQKARKTFDGQGYKEIQTRSGDGYFGWKEKGPFDAIIVTCAAGHLPPPLWEQLKPGGRIIIPIGGPYEVQRLVKVEKTLKGKRRSKTVTYVRFVPLTRGSVDKGSGKKSP